MLLFLLSFLVILYINKPQKSVICQSFFSNFSKISKNFFGTAVLGVKIAPSREPDLVDDFAISPFQERTGSKKLSYPSCAGALYSPCELYAAFCLINRTRGVSVYPAFRIAMSSALFCSGVNHTLFPSMFRNEECGRLLYLMFHSAIFSLSSS